MRVNDDEDPMGYLEKLDRFLGGEEKGVIPLEVLRAKGHDFPADDMAFDDAAMRAKLWEVLEAMAELGMVIDQTDHLSDRELYRYLVADALLVEEFLGGMTNLSPIGGGSEEDNQIYLRYYADDEDRTMWQRDFEEKLPAKEKPPYDRDRLLAAFYDGGEADVQ
jgi:hypothetical protein